MWFGFMQFGIMSFGFMQFGIMSFGFVPFGIMSFRIYTVGVSSHVHLEASLKGIVSRDWGGLQMILLDRLEVFNISATHLFLILSAFSYSKFKNGRLSGASFQHSSSKDQYSSGDSNSLA